MAATGNLPEEQHVPVMLVLGHYQPFDGLKNRRIESEHESRERRGLAALVDFSGMFSGKF